MTGKGQQAVRGGAHYTSKTMQPWDVMRSWMTPSAYEGYLRGNVIKYLARYPENARPHAEARSDDSVQTDVVCDHAFMPCWDKGCQHAVPHRIGVQSLNGMYMGDCTDERNEHVCCVATGSPERIRCVPVLNVTNEANRNDDAVEHMDSHNAPVVGRERNERTHQQEVR